MIIGIIIGFVSAVIILALLLGWLGRNPYNK